MSDIDIKDYSPIITYDKTTQRFLLYDSSGDLMGTITYAQLLTVLQAESPLDTTAIHDDQSGEINALTNKATPVDADLLLGEDSADSFSKIKIALSTLVRTASNQSINGIKTFSDLLMNGLFRLTSTTAITTGTYNAIDVTGINYINCDTSGGDVTINGLTNGSNGQFLIITKNNLSNNLIINHNNASGTEKIYTQEAVNVTYANWGLIFLLKIGTIWRSNAV